MNDLALSRTTFAVKLAATVKLGSTPVFKWYNFISAFISLARAWPSAALPAKVIPMFEVTSNIGITFAGSAADGQALAKLMKAEMKLYHLNTGVDPSLTVAASLTANVVLERAKSFIPYYVQLIMGGKDNGEYSLYSLDMGGSIIKETKFTATGSGSPIAFGVLEDN